MLFYKSLFTIFALFLFPGLIQTQGATQPKTNDTKWESAALRLTGESGNVRLQSIQKLRAIHGLENIVRTELRGKKRFLALDVISTLKLKALLPELILLSEQDESGFFYLAMNSLVNAANQSEIAQLYYSRLLDRNALPTPKVVLLDSLTRMRFRLKPEELEKFLLKDSSAEVRGAALHFLRGSLVNYGDAEYFPLLRKVLEKTDESDRRKLQALYLLSELPVGVFKALRGAKVHCPKTPPVDLKGICQKLDQARNS